MTGFPRPTAADREWFDRLVPDESTVRRRPMFGNLAAFAGDQMFLCLFGSQIAVRLDEHDRTELLRYDGSAPFEPMPGRPMREYVVLPAAWREDEDATEAWVNRSLRYALGLPPRKRR